MMEHIFIHLIMGTLSTLPIFWIVYHYGKLFFADHKVSQSYQITIQSISPNCYTLRFFVKCSKNTAKTLIQSEMFRCTILQP